MVVQRTLAATTPLVELATTITTPTRFILKRKDAFQKLRNICDRLDTLGIDVLKVTPLRLYLFGSVLTDKARPEDIDLILVYEYPPDFDYGWELAAMSYGRPLAGQRAVIELRRGMQRIQMHNARDSLYGWEQNALLLELRPRLIWLPGADWATALADIEANPLPWEGERPENAQEEFDRMVKSLPQSEFQSRLKAAIEEIEKQRL